MAFRVFSNWNRTLMPTANSFASAVTSSTTNAGRILKPQPVSPALGKYLGTSKTYFTKTPDNARHKKLAERISALEQMIAGMKQKNEINSSHKKPKGNYAHDAYKDACSAYNDELDACADTRKRHHDANAAYTDLLKQYNDGKATYADVCSAYGVAYAASVDHGKQHDIARAAYVRVCSAYNDAYAPSYVAHTAVTNTCTNDAYLDLANSFTKVAYSYANLINEKQTEPSVKKSKSIWKKIFQILY